VTIGFPRQGSEWWAGKSTLHQRTCPRQHLLRLRQDLFSRWLGPPKSHKITLAVMDRWKAFQASTQAHAPQAAIVFNL